MATESFNIQRRPLFVNTKLTTLALLVDSGSLNVLLNATAYRNDMWLLCTYYLLYLIYN